MRRSHPARGGEDSFDKYLQQSRAKFSAKIERELTENWANLTSIASHTATVAQSGDERNATKRFAKLSFLLISEIVAGIEWSRR